MVSNLTLAMRCCGSSGTASPGKSSLARSLLSATQPDLAVRSGPCGKTCRYLLSASCRTANSIRGAVAEVFSDVPHQLCHFHYLREAAKPIYDADRHAKKELKSVSVGSAPLNGASQDGLILKLKSCGATVRPCGSALTDDGCPPLEASGSHSRPPHGDYGQSRAGRKRGPAPGTKTTEGACWRGA